ncbi:MAG: N-6 DNA methylase [Ardenticatenales bacterium]|nr:N-6 DNA methylase [Ardenticatenales bacterium]
MRTAGVYDHGRGWRVALLNDKQERKASGSYYTPDYIVQYIVEQTLGPLVDELETTHADNPTKLAEAILALNVVDPAAGSGHFLVGATDYLAQRMVQRDLQPTAGDALSGETALAYWRRRVVASCIYGVDLNPLAVELAKLSLWLNTVAKDRPLSFLDHHIRVGNSLVGRGWRRCTRRSPSGANPNAKGGRNAGRGRAAFALSR